MSHVVSIRMKENQVERLRRLSRRLGRTPSEVGALLIEEALRQSEFAFIEFRDSPAGRQAYVKGTALAVWEVALVAESFQDDPEKTAHHLEWPVHLVRAALAYRDAYPEEIRVAIEDNQCYSPAALQRLLPQTETVPPCPPESD